MLTPEEAHLAELVAYALTLSARTGRYAPIVAVHGNVFASGRTAEEAALIWSMGFNHHCHPGALPCPPPLWRRIWSILSLPTPDGRPGGMWR